MSSQITLPWLQFREFRVHMPARGHSLFLDLSESARLLEGEPPRGRVGLTLFHAASGVCGVMPIEVSARKGMKPIVGLAVLHHGDELNIAGYRAVFCELARLTVQPQDHVLRRCCLYCKDPFRAGDTVIRCPLCNEAYCEKCWADLSGKPCCSRNCSFSPGPFAPPEAAADSVLLVTNPPGLSQDP